MNSPAALQELEQLVRQSPLHLPHVLALAEGLHTVFAGVPTVLMFETSFFTALSHREQAYGLDPEHMEQMALWRFGFHGILHEAACRDAVSRLGVPTARVVSICLEPRPELAACVGVRPVLVTGGNTPLDGLPGERSCGDLDPSVALKLAHDLPGGVEEANQVLTRESGLLGLIGKPVSLAELLMSERSDWQLARDVFRHSVLRACGAAIAAISGVDMFVYSGRYAAAGGALHQWLAPRLARATCAAVPYLLHTRTLAQQMHDVVRVELCAARM
jgi:acetate kinase